VNRIQQLFKDSFDIIQESVRRIERALRDLRTEIMIAVIEDLDNSRWNNLRDQAQRMNEEITRVHALYQSARQDLDSNLTNIETNLTDVLTGQVSKRQRG